jgi:hypothetical protein
LYRERIVAATQPTPLGEALKRAWPVEERPRFERLIEAVNVADRKLWEVRAMAL